MKQRFFHLCYGPVVLEAIALDMILDSMHDGLPRPYQKLVTPTGKITVWELQRKVDQLIAEGMIKILGDNILITSKGMLHLANGGYVAEVKLHRRMVTSFWLSVSAFIVSVTTAVLNWLHIF
jgi:hypothetical protein